MNTIDNYFIADQFALLAKLMDIHGENSFKAKSYSAAAFTLEKLPYQIHSIDPSKIFSIKGIGESTGKAILEILETGKLSALEKIISKTPKGILEMMNIKGIGPKKIATIWKELEIETLGELLYACNENRLLLYKGFGAKTQQNIKESIEFYLNNQGNFLFAEAEKLMTSTTAYFVNEIGGLWEVTGSFVRQEEIITELEWISTADPTAVKNLLTSNQFHLETESPDQQLFIAPNNARFKIHYTTPDLLAFAAFEKSCTSSYWSKLIAVIPSSPESHIKSLSEEAISQLYPAFYRDQPETIGQVDLNDIITHQSIKGIIHSHSNWSDGAHTIEEMILGAMKQGFEYLILSDHSKSAFYANGLTEERIVAQHQLIDELNAKYSNFRVFKSIEADILNDGSLDYDDELLSTFDIVIASVHSNLKMDKDKAMMRLLKAIENPYTSILGHMTGRLLLSRNGYPVDHEKIIDACVANDVVIELNAHPRRLDIDWRWIRQAVDKGVMISINPDAHAVEGYHDIRYGVLVAQKAGLKSANNLSSMSRTQIETFMVQQHKKRN